MKFVSWNVNGLRACIKKGFLTFFQSIDADVFCLQETKLQEGQVSLELPGYHLYWNYAEKKGYSGTAMFCKQEPLSVSYGIGDDSLTGEGAQYHCGISRVLSCDRLYAQLAGPVKANRLPHGVGRCLSCIPANA